MFVRTLMMTTILGWVSGGIATADHYPEIMFILDSSGSMSEAAGDKPKIVAAKEVMHEIVPQLNENIRVGLTAYGHRRPGDCSDIEVLIPAGSDDRSALLDQVNKLQPRGRTPISAAILSVASSLKLKDAETSIILVSDGIETCGGDPCAVVKQLKSTGIKFVLHVVGFDVNAAAEQQLKCAAGAGGGQYFAAGNSAQLLEALKAVSSEVLAKVQKVDPAKVKARTAKSGLGKLRVTMPIGSEVSLNDITIGAPESGDIKRKVDKPKPDATYPFVSGTYSVSLGFATPSYGRPTISKLGNITISKGETHELKLGSISFNIPKDLESKIAVDEVLIADAGTGEVIVTVRKNGNSYYHFKPKPVVAGIYNVLFKYSINKGKHPTVVAENVTVAPGEDTVVTLHSGIQLKKANDVVAWELIPATERTVDTAEEGETTVAAPAALKVVHSGFGNQARMWYPHVVVPGTYNLNVYLKGMTDALPVGEGIVIQAGELLQFDAGL